MCPITDGIVTKLPDSIGGDDAREAGEFPGIAAADGHDFDETSQLKRDFSEAREHYETLCDMGRYD